MGEGDGVAIMCRNHRGFIDATLARLQARRQRPLHEHRLLRAAAGRRDRARGAGGAHLRRGVHRAARKASEAGSEIGSAVRRLERGRGRREGGRHARRADRVEQRRPTSTRPTESGRFVILTSGTTGTPKGAQRAQPDTLSPLASMFSKIPLRARREDGDRRAAVPLLGLRPLRARARAQLDLRPAPQVRPGGHAQGDRRRAAPRRWSSSR